MSDKQKYNKIENQELLIKGIEEAKKTGNYDNVYINKFIENNQALVKFFIKKNLYTIKNLGNFYTIDDFNAIFTLVMFNAIKSYNPNSDASFSTYVLSAFHHKFTHILRDVNNNKNKTIIFQKSLESKISNDKKLTLADILTDEKAMSVEELCIENCSVQQFFQRLKLVLSDKDYIFVINFMKSSKLDYVKNVMGLQKNLLAKIKCRIIKSLKLWQQLATFSVSKENWELLTTKLYPNIGPNKLYKEWMKAQLVINGKLDLNFFYSKLNEQTIDNFYKKYVLKILNKFDDKDKLNRIKFFQLLPFDQSQLLSLKFFNKLKKEEILSILNIKPSLYSKIEKRLLQNLGKVSSLDKESFNLLIQNNKNTLSFFSENFIEIELRNGIDATYLFEKKLKTLVNKKVFVNRLKKILSPEDCDLILSNYHSKFATSSICDNQVKETEINKIPTLTSLLMNMHSIALLFEKGFRSQEIKDIYERQNSAFKENYDMLFVNSVALFKNFVSFDPKIVKREAYKFSSPKNLKKIQETSSLNNLRELSSSTSNQSNKETLLTKTETAGDKSLIENS